MLWAFFYLRSYQNCELFTQEIYEKRFSGVIPAVCIWKQQGSVRAKQE